MKINEAFISFLSHYRRAIMILKSIKNHLTF